MQPDQPSRKPPSKVYGIDAVRANSRNPQQPVKARVLRMPRLGNGERPDPNDPSGISAGQFRPAVIQMERSAPMVVRQFVDADGDARIVARRFGVKQRFVNKLVAKAIRPVLNQILSGEKAA